MTSKPGTVDSDSDNDFLQGFSAAESGPDDGRVSILPPQRPSVREDVELVFEASGTSVSLSLSVDAGPGCGGVAWPAGEVLSKYLTRRGPTCITGKACLELGSGTGLVGIIAAKLGAQCVFVTDQAPLLGLLEANVRKNGVAGRTKVLELNWGDALPALAPIDLILAADCVYFETAFPLLCKTLRELHDAHPSSEILFCYKKRRKASGRYGLAEIQLTHGLFVWV
ncbi:hypothetical protein FRB94_010156 [Tulasnella sp. JGI-2019a]|nr:hypothetical protein FRB94_010156 [Tulasnella sp. JGI-2019a]KAG9018356.1 hypothetical protein FRB93_000059 [Tulasnella sp. JGI-2019a]